MIIILLLPDFFLDGEILSELFTNGNGSAMIERSMVVLALLSVALAPVVAVLNDSKSRSALLLIL